MVTIVDDEPKICRRLCSRGWGAGERTAQRLAVRFFSPFQVFKYGARDRSEDRQAAKHDNDDSHQLLLSLKG
jgi:hypothetical protein